MKRRVLGWGGAVVCVVVLGGVFVLVGLDKGDKLASVLGAFIGLAGLGVAVYGLRKSRAGGGEDSGTYNTISGTVYGTAVQARDVQNRALAPGESEGRVWEQDS